MSRIDHWQFRSKLFQLKTLTLAVGCLCSCVTILFHSTPAMASEFQVGEIVLYDYCGKEVEGKIARQDQHGILVLVKHWQDGTFHADGSSLMMSAAELRHKDPGPQVGNPREANLGGYDAGGGKPPAKASAGMPVGNAPAGNTPAVNTLVGSGLMSKQEIIDFLKARINTSGPHPQREQVCKELCDAIKKRGINYKHSPTDDFAVTDAGGNTAVNYTLSVAYGAPKKIDWLMGEWDISLTQLKTYSPSTRDVHKYGFISIEKDGKYLWKISSNDPPPAWRDGKWRLATPAEMIYQGGDGIVLLDGKDGTNWIVFQDKTASLNQDWVKIADINYRQTQFGGLRAAN